MTAAISSNTALSALTKPLDMSRIPAHIAIITDGNGRWAKQRSKPRIFGHTEGYKTVRNIVRFAGEIGVRVLTLYVFSVENWKRPETETSALMSLIEQAARNELEDLARNNVRIRFSGRRAGLPPSLQAEMERATTATAQNTGLILNLAVNYGGRAELTDAVTIIAQKVAKGELSANDVTEETIRAHTYSPDLPDPDLIIRTAGEMRLSNFLLWGGAYAEFWVTKAFWPDFTSQLLVDAIVDYQGRVRKFGMTLDS
jgi:undecaprenyl diphosphate synthase